MAISFVEWVFSQIGHFQQVPSLLFFLLVLLVSSAVLLGHPAGALVAGVAGAVSGPLPDFPVPVAESCFGLGVDSVGVGDPLDGGDECVSAGGHNIASIGCDEHVPVVAVRVVIVARVVGVSVANWDSH